MHLLTTARLTLVLPEPSLARSIADYYARNASRLEPISPRREPGFHSVAQWTTRAAERQAQALAGSAFHLVVTRSQQPAHVIGTIELTNIVRGAFQAAHLGYSIDREHEGQGLMTEALREVIRHAFEEMGLHRLMANYLPTNDRSANVLSRLGFTVEGYARAYLKLDGRWQDHVLTSLVNPRDADQ